MSAKTTQPHPGRYIPVVVHSEHEAALDALLSIGVPRDEAMDLIVSGWQRLRETIFAHTDGGRPVAVVPLSDGRWAAGNAFPGLASPSEAVAMRSLARVAGRGGRGLVVSASADTLVSP